MIAYTPPAEADDAIPVISYARAGGGPDERRHIAQAIGRACRGTGFFYLVDHGIPDALIDGQLDAARRFFALPIEAKTTFASKSGRRGYEPIAAQSLDAGTPPDLKESMLFGGDDTGWPDLPGFESQVSAYRDAMMALGRRLAASVALSLDLTEDYFAASLADPSCTVRLLRYPPHPVEAESNQLGSGAHTDWGFLTLLLQDTIGGLEVRTASGQWIRATPIDRALVVNLGDLVPHLTNGLYQSNYHRVLNNVARRDRYSVATFFNPAGAVEFDTVPTCRPADWVPNPRTVQEHVAAKIRETYAAG